MSSNRATVIDMVVWNTFQNDARVKNEAETLQNAGYEVTIHALHAESFTHKREVLPSGIKVIRHGEKQGLRLLSPQKHTARRNNLELVFLMISRMMTHFMIFLSIVWRRPDVVHAHDVNVLPTAWLAARLSFAKLVYDAHEISSGREGYRKLGRLVARIEKTIMPGCAGTITTTEARAKFFARAYLIDRPLVLQNRPRLAEVANNQRIRHELQLSDDFPIIIYQGGLQPGRGLERLINAALEVKKAYFVFVGGGSLQADLQLQVKELELDTRVFFIHTVPLEELPNYTASADIGVQPIENTCLNHFTTDSNKLFEYMVAGLPVVATQLPEISRIINTWHFGELVKSADTEALVKSLNKLVSDKALREKYAKNAKQAAQFVNWQAQEALLINFYKEIVHA